jgi:hypothetical protein
MAACRRVKSCFDGGQLLFAESDRLPKIGTKGLSRHRSGWVTSRQAWSLMRCQWPRLRGEAEKVEAAGQAQVEAQQGTR